MKIRTDFVTNSSSSSYVIAFKGFPKIDEDTIEKYPFLENFQKMIKEAVYGTSGASYETDETVTCSNLIDLRDYIQREYGYNNTFEQTIEEDEYARDIYNDSKEWLEKGYDILFKDVGYEDFRNGLFERLASDDFVIISGRY